MAHLVDSMAFVGQTPWHGLGNQLAPKQPIEVWAEQAGMNWTIQESPVHFIAVHESQAHLQHPLIQLKDSQLQQSLDQVLPFTDHKVLFRSDTREPLSVVSQRYHVVQPREILEFYRDLTEKSDFELETAGVLKGGRKLWALARTGQSAAIKGKDVTNGYVLLATACDGTLATTAQFTSIRVVCNNTLAIALNEMAGKGNKGSSALSSQGIVKVPHNTKFDAASVKQALGISVSSWDEYIYRLNLLSDRKVKPTEADHFLWDVFNDGSSRRNSNRAGNLGNGSFNERAINKTKTLFEGHGRGAMLQSAGGTAFGLLNSVTEFIDHERKAKSIDHRLDSAWFGTGAAIKQRALDLAIAMI
jgi:phage/plasmid-like protein (TIGR03299 family)